jgi:hypothetical protein
MGFGTIPREQFVWYNKIKREKHINENVEKGNNNTLGWGTRWRSG